MGVPRLWGKVGQFADYDYIPSELKAKRDDPPIVRVGNCAMENRDEPVIKSVEMLPPDGPENLRVGWTVLYYVLIPIGAYGFYKLLFPLTESSLALAKI